MITSTGECSCLHAQTTNYTDKQLGGASFDYKCSPITMQHHYGVHSSEFST